MKKYRFQFNAFLLSVFAMFMFGCTDVLEKKNLDNLVEDDLWVDPVLLKGFMDKVMDQNLPGTDTWSSTIDENYDMYGNALLYDNLQISAGGGDGAGIIENWSYGAIRSINKFLENADKCPETQLPVATKNDYIAQMKTLRAWKYFEMVRLYGGVPLVLHAQEPDEDLFVSRAKTSECIDQIVKDLNEAIASPDFPMKRTNDLDGGRLTKAVALAIKGRVLLYYASPQFSKQTPAGTKDAATRWKEAYDANKAAIDQLSAAGFGLFRPVPADFNEAVKNRKDMFSEENEIGKNPEMIWVKRFGYPARTSYAAPIMGYLTIEMANSYANADGTPYTDMTVLVAGSQGVALDITNIPFWQGREPRFYTDVLYNGKEHPMFRLNALANDKDATGKQIHWWKFVGGANAPFYECGRMDEKGMDIAKKCNTDKYNETVSPNNTSGMDWPLIRYAEVMLNLAECAAKTNNEAEARTILYDIRKRAGIPQGANNYGIGAPSGEALILAILNERKIELAFEGFRFWDIRRWRLFTDELNGYKMNGMYRHTLKAHPAQIPDPTSEDPDHTKSLTITADLLKTIDMSNPDTYFDVFDNRIWTLDSSPFNVTERQYFYRIAEEQHLKKNPNLKQTKLWGDGTFDPYE